jgi:hypothetical protein
MSAGHTTRTAPARDPPATDWLELNAKLADLALASARSPSRAPHLTQSRHLAFLPPEALDLDLSDSLQRDFGDYELIEKLGQGGMGVVYRARQKSLDRDVAIKLLAAGPWASTEFIDRFRREAQSAARMQHPNIVSIYEVGTHEELNYFSMQIVRGESLAARLAREQRVAPAAAAQLVRTVAEAVDYAHRLGVLHLDLKPGNVLLDERGEPQVADFGLARRLDESLAVDSDEVSGTPSYMAPEQATARGHRLTPATDVYGLGAILYELLTGVPPFFASTPHETLREVVEGRVLSARERSPGVPRDLDAICMRCLEKDPGRRYASARTLTDDLSAFLDGRAVSVRPLNAAQRLMRWARRQPRQAALAVLLIASFVAGFLATSVQWRRAEGNAALSSAMLWDSRRQEAVRLAQEGRGFDAMPILLANIEEQERAGRSATDDRHRFGTLAAQGPQLIDRMVVPDVTPTAAELSDDGATLAIGFDDLTVRWYDTATLSERGRVELYGHPTSDDMHGFNRVPILLRFVGADRLRVTLEWYETWVKPVERDTYLVDLDKGATVDPPAAFAGLADAAFSADGRFAVLHDRRGQAQLWQVDPWRPVSDPYPADTPPMPYILGRGAVFAATFSEGMTAVSFVDPRAPMGRPLLQLPEQASVAAWSESSDGRWVALGDQEGRVFLVACADWSVRQLPVARGGEINWLAFSEDGAWLAAANQNGTAHAFEVATGELLSSDNLRHDFGLQRVAIHRGQHLLVASGGGRVALWRLPVPGPLAQPGRRLDTSPTPALGAGPHAVGFSAGSGLLVTAGADGEVRLWRVPAAPLRAARPGTQLATATHFDGRRLVDIAYDHLRIVAVDGRALSDWIVLPQPPAIAELVDGGRTLVLTSGRELRVYDTDGLKLRYPPWVLRASPQRMAIDRQGRVAVLSFGGSGKDRGFEERIEVFDVGAGRLRPESAVLPGPLIMSLSGNGERLLATGPRAATTTAFEVAGLRRVGDYPHDTDAPVVWSTFDADGRRVLLVERAPDSVIADDALVEWDPATGALSRRGIPGMLPTGVIATPAGPFVAGMSRDAFDPGGPAQRGVERRAESQPLATLAVSGDGRLLAHAFRYREIELLIIDSGTQLGATLYSNLDGVDLLARLTFADDGRSLLARDTRGRTQVWPIAIDQRPLADMRGDVRMLQSAVVRGSRTIARLGSPSLATSAPDAAGRQRLRRRDPGAWVVDGVRPEPRWLRHVGGLGIPPRSPAATPLMLDLSAVYNIAPDAELHQRKHMIATMYHLPWGVQRIDGVDYDIRGMVELFPPSGAGQTRGRPSRAPGVPVPAVPIAAFHVLLFAGHRSTEPEVREYARLRLHYRDGSEAVAPIRTQVDVPGWTENDRPVPAGWAYGEHLPLLAEPNNMLVNDPRIVNPHPERLIASLDLEAGSGTWNSPVFLAITAEPVIETATTCIGCRAESADPVVPPRTDR